MELAAQIIGIVGMVIIVVSFAQKQQRTIIIMQFAGSLLFATNMLMLGAISGGLMNVGGIVRGIVFLNKKRIEKYKWFFVTGLSVLYIALYSLSFVVFGKAATAGNLAFEFLPVFSMIMMTIGYAADGAKKTRIFGFINSPPWLVYNMCNFNIGGTICEIFCMSSIILGMIRYDRKGVNKNGTV